MAKEKHCSPFKLWMVLAFILAVVLFDVSGLDNIIHGFLCSFINVSGVPCPLVYDMPFWDSIIVVLLFFILKFLYFCTRKYSTEE
jgi:hypothetical protein